MPELSALDYLNLFLGGSVGLVGFVYLVVALVSAFHPRAKAVSLWQIPVSLFLLLLSYFLIGLVF